jgi:hypothetical protein
VTRARKILIALDQLLGAFLFSGIGPDETISAYCWRRGYRRRVAILDFFLGENHCHDAYLSELSGAHLDPDYHQEA